MSSPNGTTEHPSRQQLEAATRKTLQEILSLNPNDDAFELAFDEWSRKIQNETRRLDELKRGT